MLRKSHIFVWATISLFSPLSAAQGEREPDASSMIPAPLLMSFLINASYSSGHRVNQIMEKKMHASKVTKR